MRNQCRGLPFSARQLAAIIHALDASGRFAVPAGELSVAILDAAGITRVHADFMADPTPTDVITFEGDPALDSAGEICVCADIARDYAKQHGLEFARELALYIAHGYLHLAGFDDTTAPARRLMRRAEQEALTLLQAAKLI